jgi:hypothetical protein
MKIKPVLISHDSVALITLLKRNVDISDEYDNIYVCDYLTDNGLIDEFKISVESGKRYIEALEDHWNIVFLESVIKECIKLIKEQSKKHNPEFLEGLKKQIVEQIPDIGDKK